MRANISTITETTAEPPARRCLSEREAAAWLGIGYSTLRELRAVGAGPIARRPTARRIVYHPAMLEAWLAARPRR